jgi:peptidoglycan hydrolase FlgJ
MPIAPDLPSITPPQRHGALRAKAEEIEATFLSEMLSHAGLDALSDSFGGGIGEEQFSSFLRDEQAKAMVQHGGIGLAGSLFRAMGGIENDQ